MPETASFWVCLLACCPRPWSVQRQPFTQLIANKACMHPNNPSNNANNRPRDPYCAIVFDLNPITPNPRWLCTVDAFEAVSLVALSLVALSWVALSWVAAFFAFTPKKLARDTFGLNLLAILWLMLLLLRDDFGCVVLTGAKN